MGSVMNVFSKLSYKWGSFHFLGHPVPALLTLMGIVMYVFSKLSYKAPTFPVYFNTSKHYYNIWTHVRSSAFLSWGAVPSKCRRVRETINCYWIPKPRTMKWWWVYTLSISLFPRQVEWPICSTTRSVPKAIQPILCFPRTTFFLVSGVPINKNLSHSCNFVSTLDLELRVIT